jgi:signal transduction histidine kinase
VSSHDAGVLHACMQNFPGLVLQLSRDGRVCAANVAAQELLGAHANDGMLGAVLEESSREKLAYLLSRTEDASARGFWELAFRSGTKYDVREFVPVWSEDDTVWLIERMPDVQSRNWYEQFSDLNAQLVATQRELRREKSELIEALAREAAARSAAETAHEEVIAANQAVHQALRGREDVLAVVSHDLRTPLATIVTAIAMLREAELPQERYDRFLEIIHRSSQTMIRLIEDLLEIAKLESGQTLSINPIPENAQSLVEEVCARNEDHARRRDISLRCTADALPSILADRERVLQVLGNLVGNSLKFVSAGGSITVSASALDDAVQFAVRDTGPGIPTDHLPHLFDRYWQGEGKRRGGAGLGLAISKAIVEAHGGRIWVESTVGVGTMVSFTVPTVHQPGRVVAETA